MIIGIVALITELIEYEEIAKVVVIPCLVLLISVTGYSLFQTFRYKKSYKILERINSISNLIIILSVGSELLTMRIPTGPLTTRVHILLLEIQ